MNPDYMMSLLADPAELLRVLEGFCVFMKSLENNDGVAELYSPPRVVEWAKRYGLKPGLSLDLSEIEAVNLKAENDEFDLATDLQEACVNSKLKLIFNNNSSKAQGA